MSFDPPPDFIDPRAAGRQTVPVRNPLDRRILDDEVLEEVTYEMFKERKALEGAPKRDNRMASRLAAKHLFHAHYRDNELDPTGNREKLKAMRFGPPEGEEKKDGRAMRVEGGKTRQKKEQQKIESYKKMFGNVKLPYKEWYEVTEEEYFRAKQGEENFRKTGEQYFNMEEMDPNNIPLDKKIEKVMEIHDKLTTRQIDEIEEKMNLPQALKDAYDKSPAARLSSVIHYREIPRIIDPDIPFYRTPQERKGSVKCQHILDEPLRSRKEFTKTKMEDWIR